MLHSCLRFHTSKIQIVAVYTANLAAILTRKVQATTIGSLEEALAAKYRICSERKNLETVLSLYPNIDKSLLAVDPVDGKPGFNCPDCAARNRVFDFLDMKKANVDEAYCHAAFAPREDLEIMQKSSMHCNKTFIGSPVGSVQTGIPVYERVSTELISYFLMAKNEGIFDRQLIINRPVSVCPSQTQGEEGDALDIPQLSGIWIVSFGFASIGLIVTFLTPKIEKARKKKVQYVFQYDQHGIRINVLEKDDSWIDKHTVMKGDKRIFVGDSRWGGIMESTSTGMKSSRNLMRALSRRSNLCDDASVDSKASNGILSGIGNPFGRGPGSQKRAETTCFESIKEVSCEMSMGNARTRPFDIDADHSNLEATEGTSAPTNANTESSNTIYFDENESDVHCDDGLPIKEFPPQRRQVTYLTASLEKDEENSCEMLEC